VKIGLEVPIFNSTKHSVAQRTEKRFDEVKSGSFVLIDKNGPGLEEHPAGLPLQ
jgi:hypothetical protein